MEKGKMTSEDFRVDGMDIKEYGKLMLRCSKFMDKACNAIKDGEFEKDDEMALMTKLALVGLIYQTSEERLSFVMDMKMRQERAKREESDGLIRGLGIGLEGDR